MAAKNTKLLHESFGRAAVMTSDPDASWPLPSELIGVEIEVENLRRNNRNNGSLQRYWTTHQDGSLRNGTEFVLAAPTGGRQLTEAIDAFFDAGMTYETNPRTSIHVHINASDNMTVDQFRNMFTIMYLIEPAVFRWADENRKWCGYCAPLTDLAPYRIINILNDDQRDSTRFVLAVRGDSNHDRYYGFNVAAFNRHGTVEFRYFPCTTEKAKMVEWIKFCMYVKRTARRFDSPEDILRVLSNEPSVTSFLNEWFPDIAQHLIRNLDINDCLARVQEMGTMVNVSPETLRSGETYHSYTRSRGLSRYLAKNFPELVPTTGANGTAASARTASDLYDTLASATTTRRVRESSRTPDQSDSPDLPRPMNRQVTLEDVRAAEREYTRTISAYNELPSASRARRRNQARITLEEFNRLYILQSANNSSDSF